VRGQACRARCREHSEAAAKEIVRLFSESQDDRVRYMAAQWTYEQAWGKVEDYMESYRLDYDDLSP